MLLLVTLCSTGHEGGLCDRGIFGRNWVMEDGTVPVKNRSDSPVEKNH
jgi:hypothetical protein